MPRFSVQSIVSQEQWSSNHGAMISWNLGCINMDTGKPEVIQLNSKPENTYSVGTEFHADWTGKDYQGIKKYKRVQPQGNGATSSAQPSSSPAAAQPGFMLGGGSPKPAAMPYAEALKLTAMLAKDVCLEHGLELGGRLLTAILRGEVENPVKPKVVVTWMSNEIETAGIEQQAFNEVMELSQALAAETDEKNVRALLIATCGVATRKSLTADKARLFIQTLKTNLAALKKTEPEPWPDEEF